MQIRRDQNMLDRGLPGDSLSSWKLGTGLAGYNSLVVLQIGTEALVAAKESA